MYDWWWGVASGLRCSNGSSESIAGTEVEEPRKGQAVFDGVVPCDREGVALVIQTVCPFIMDAVHERLVGIVEGRLARVLHPRVSIGDAVGKTMLKRMTKSHLKSIVDGACIVWSKELVDIRERLGADVEAAGRIWGGVLGHPHGGTCGSLSRSVLRARTVVELRIGRVLNQIGVEADPVMVKAGMDVI